MTDRWLDAAYDDYHAWKGWRDERDAEGEVTRALAELRMADVPPPARLLEVGFGDGAVLKRARALGYRCAGLERVGAPLPEFGTAEIDARTGLPDRFAGEMFDLIAAFDVFEHLTVPDLIETLRGLAERLTPNGRLVARFPNMASPFGLVNQHGDITHLTALSPGSFAQVARLAGFEIVRVANGATVLGGGRGLRALLKPVALLTRKLIELVLSFAYYGRVTPLSPSVVVVARRRG